MNGEKMMNVFKGIASTCLVLLCGTAMASTTCNKPKEQWMSEAAFRAKVEQQGYTIQKFKVSSGQCYEIYGTDKAGKKVEIYFDPVSAEVVKRK
jgi:hypothetical protein